MYFPTFICIVHGCEGFIVDSSDILSNVTERSTRVVTWDVSRLRSCLFNKGSWCSRGVVPSRCPPRPPRDPPLWPVPSVALRKTETSHHLSLDKASIPPEGAQKSAPLPDLPQKPPGDLPPKPTELAPKPQIGDLPPKPGELPPKPQLGDLPPKPHLSDLPPKPQMKDLPPKPQLADLLAKAQPTDGAPKSHSVDLSPNVPARDAIQKQASEDSNDLTPEMPVPLPRKINTVGPKAGCGGRGLMQQERGQQGR